MQESWQVVTPLPSKSTWSTASHLTSIYTSNSSSHSTSHSTSHSHAMIPTTTRQRERGCNNQAHGAEGELRPGIKGGTDRTLLAEAEDPLQEPSLGFAERVFVLPRTGLVNLDQLRKFVPPVVRPRVVPKQPVPCGAVCCVVCAVMFSDGVMWFRSGCSLIQPLEHASQQPKSALNRRCKAAANEPPTAVPVMGCQRKRQARPPSRIWFFRS
jgi:hypothetical protein